MEADIEDIEEEEARLPKLPHDPGRPTKRELREHLPLHWPFRSWCRHCVMGRAVSSPHKSRTDDDREFGRGRIPTLSLDHCFLGSEESEESAHRNPFLVLYDNETEAIFAVAVASKASKPWIVEHVKKVIYELGYDQLKIAVKCDGARELQELRRAIGNSREAPTVPIDVPVKESKANGGMERAVRTWTGQFRTLKSHLEYELKQKIPLRHPILQWMAVWAAGIFTRFAVRHHGRTAHEYATGHKTKLPVACFGETVLWRQRRATSELGKYDVEYREGIYLGMSGMSSELLLGTREGVVKSRDIRVLSDEKARWNYDFVMEFNTHVEQHINPSEGQPEHVEIEPGLIAHDELPADPDVTVTTRRMRLLPTDFLEHGYTAGCPGCDHIRRQKTSRNHTEACRKRMENCMADTAAGKARLERETARREEELTEALKTEDERIRVEQALTEAAKQREQPPATEARDALPQGEQADVDIAEEQSEPRTPRASASRSDQWMDDAAGEYSPTSPAQSAHGSRDVYIGTPGTPSEEAFATDRAPANLRDREHYMFESPPRSAKKTKPTSSAQRDVDERAGGQVRDRPDSSSNSPSGVQGEPKRAREQDEEMADLSVLAAMLKGVDITEVY